DLKFWIQVLESAVALFIITDSIGNLPFYLSLTEGTSKEEHNKVTLTAVASGLILLAVFVFAGNLFLSLFALTIDDLKIAGGILLFVIAIKILIDGKIVSEHKEDIGVVPLGIPLLVGPGAITTVLVMTKTYDFYAVCLGTLICFFLIWLVFHFGEIIFRFIGHNGSLIITKISSILIAGIAIRFIRTAIQSIFGV
ncbi:MAG: MarC family protein, partial [Candidatus Margulisiibacteriota bacterium]